MTHRAAMLCEPDGTFLLSLDERTFATEPDSSVPTYRFRMVDATTAQSVGSINLRAGFTENITLFRGNIGYAVDEAFRGRRYAYRSCRLLAQFIQALGLAFVWMTCNQDNIASQRTLERLGAAYIDTTRMPADSPYAQYYPLPARAKLRYRWDLRQPAPIR